MSGNWYRIDVKTTKPIKALRYTCLKTVSDVKKLLGLLGYFRHYIQDVSRIASPLYDLLKFDKTSESLQLHSKNKRKSIHTNQLLSSHKVEWKKIHQKFWRFFQIIECKTTDGPVYVMHSEKGAKLRVLHRNLLLPYPFIPTNSKSPVRK